MFSWPRVASCLLQRSGLGWAVGFLFLFSPPLRFAFKNIPLVVAALLSEDGTATSHKPNPCCEHLPAPSTLMRTGTDS